MIKAGVPTFSYKIKMGICPEYCTEILRTFNDIKYKKSFASEQKIQR